MNQTTFIVALTLDGGSPSGPQLPMWAVRTTSAEKAETMIRPLMGDLNIVVLTVAGLNDFGRNVLEMPDDFIRTLG